MTDSTPMDLIRRIDAVRACHGYPSDGWAKATKDGYYRAATALSAQLAAVTAERDAAVARVGVLEAALRHADEGLNYLHLYPALAEGTPT